MNTPAFPPFITLLLIEQIYYCYFAGAIINTSLVITFLNFTPTQDNVYVYFIFAGLWGMADAIWQTQLNGEELVMINLSWFYVGTFNNLTLTD